MAFGTLEGLRSGQIGRTERLTALPLAILASNRPTIWQSRTKRNDTPVAALHFSHFSLAEPTTVRQIISVNLDRRHVSFKWFFLASVSIWGQFGTDAFFAAYRSPSSTRRLPSAFHLPESVEAPVAAVAKRLIEGSATWGSMATRSARASEAVTDASVLVMR